MPALVRENEHFIGTFFYWIPSMVVLIISKEVSDYIYISSNGLQVFFIFVCIYTPIYGLVLRRFYKKRCITNYVEVFLVFAIYSSMFLWCYHSQIIFFESLALVLNVEKDSVKNIVLIAYIFLVFEIANIISKFEYRRLRNKSDESN